MPELDPRINTTVLDTVHALIIACDPEGRIVGWNRATVADTGTGIAPETLRRLFEPFYTTKGRGQAAASDWRSARVIVTSHGGAIDVASELGSGTEFRVVFPEAFEK